MNQRPNETSTRRGRRPPDFLDALALGIVLVAIGALANVLVRAAGENLMVAGVFAGSVVVAAAVVRLIMWFDS